MVQVYSNSEGNEAGGGEINRLNPLIKAMFERAGSQNTSPDQTVERPLAKIIDVQPPPAPVPEIGEQNKLTPMTVTALFSYQERKVSPSESTPSPAEEGLGQGPTTASPALTATT